MIEIDLIGILCLLLLMFALFGFGSMCDTADRQRKYTYERHSRERSSSPRKRGREPRGKRKAMNDFQQCKRCERLCNREHFAVQNCTPTDRITYLYCDDCNRGWESVWTLVGGRWKWEWDLEHGPHNQREFDRFLLDLKMANSVAA